ncbi:hypothetical protein ACSQ67_013129 [Phaseolus vulgaris]
MDFSTLTLVVIIGCYFCHCLSTANDTITSGQFFRDPQTLISANGVFKLGFFSPQNSSFRYLGIWYLSDSNVIWVANRNQPLTNNSSGLFQISVHGNLVVLDSNKRVIWSSNVTHIATNSTAKLLETGNLVLLDGVTGQSIWESFQHPSHALVPSMKFGTNKRTGVKVRITSWRSPSDPSVGYYSTTLEHPNTPEMIFWLNETKPYHRSGPWNNQIFIGSPEMSPGYLNGWSMMTDIEDETVYLSYNLPNQSYFGIMTLNPQGQIVCSWWNNEKLVQKMAMQRTVCDLYGYCGAFATCNVQSSPICSCLSGYGPKNVEEWNRKNWTSGCVRSEPLHCGEHTNASEVRKDVFLKLENMKVPDFVHRSDSLEDECKSECLENCSCVAFAYDRGIGCMVWSGDLIDIQKFSSGGVDLYIREPPSENEKHSDTRRKRRFIIPVGVGVPIGMLILAGCLYLSWKCTDKSTGKIYSQRQGRNQKQVKLNDELPLFSFEELVNATHNFHSSNELGKGGFGSVYKGELKEGAQIAVKRLSETSGQGLEECMNEVLVISKLQHRNLVKLLGCCIKQEENMLAWKLWNEKDIQSLIDPEICNPNNVNDIVRCVHIGLLCLQNLAKERPSMATVVSMLNSEILNLPCPSHPAFVERQIASSAESFQQNNTAHSINNVTVTVMMQGR